MRVALVLSVVLAVPVLGGCASWVPPARAPVVTQTHSVAAASGPSTGLVDTLDGERPDRMARRAAYNEARLARREAALARERERIEARRVRRTHRRGWKAGDGLRLLGGLAAALAGGGDDCY